MYMSGYADSKSVTSVGRDIRGNELEDKIGTAGVCEESDRSEGNGIMVHGVENKGIRRSETG